MNPVNKSDESVVALLKQELSDDVPTATEARLARRLGQFRVSLGEPQPQWARWRWLTGMPRPLAWAAGLAPAAALLLVFLILWSGSGNIARAAIAALEHVQTVHLSGWTSRIIRSHNATAEESTYQPETHYPVEIWEWTAPDGAGRRYQREGPVTTWADGERCYEHQTDRDLLYVDEAIKVKPGARFPALSRELSASISGAQSLGEKIADGGRRVVGLRLEKNDDRRELWFDAQSKLPVKVSRFRMISGQWIAIAEAMFEFDKPVPKEVVAYVPPKAKKVEYSSHISPQFEQWHLRLRELAAYYQQHPLPEKMELLPRFKDETMASYSYGTMPGIAGYGVVQLASWFPGAPFRLADYLIQWQPLGTLRLPEELGQMTLNHDLVVKNGIDTQEQLRFVLDSLGLKIVTRTEPRTIWVAHFDGRKLKPWQQVKAPVPNPRNEPLRPGMASGSGGATMAELFGNLVHWQNYSLEATGILIDDQTGLVDVQARTKEVKVSSESPYFGGAESLPAESLPIARQWFAEQFGVTFEEQVRPTPVSVVERK